MARIVYAGHTPIPSDAANSIQILKMVAALASLGHSVRLLSPWHGGRARSRDSLQREFGVSGDFDLTYLPLISFGSRLQGSYYLITPIAAAALRPDLVVTREVRIALLSAKLGCDVVLESHTPFGSQRSLSAAHQLSHHHRLRRWVFISDELRLLVREQVAIPEEKSLVAHSAVDLTAFRPPVQRDLARARLGLDPNRPLVVYAGHLYPGRGGELLIQAAATLTEVDFVLVGGVERDVARLKQLAAQTLVANVSIVERKPPTLVPLYLFAADVLIIPHTAHSMASDRATPISGFASPLKLFEYMAAGRPIIATRFPSIAEILVHGRNGLLIEPDDVQAIVSSIRRLLGDLTLSTDLARNARMDVEEFTWLNRCRGILSGLV